jgi:DUF1680 family protein
MNRIANIWYSPQGRSWTKISGESPRGIKPIMIKLFLILAAGILACSEQKEARDYPVVPVDFTKVKIEKGFWQSRVRTACDVTIPYAFRKCQETGRIDNFIFAGGLRKGKFRGRYGFDDSDVYKIIEGASYSLMLKPDPEMEAYLDTLVGYIAAAQEPDGYLYTAWTLKANGYNDFACCTYSPEGKFVGTPESSHEFYDAGHMYEAAVAHYLATGKRTFLNVAIKNANLIYNVCITRGKPYTSGHQEIEIGLVKLYRATGDKRYLELAKHLLDIRGQNGGSAYSQSDMPPIDQREAEGHAVRANYMYTAMADVAALTGDTAYLAAIDAIWNNVVGRKLSVTGGVGASPRGEAYGADYDLPNTPYNETCAAIANVYWNHRMFLLHGDSKYIDVLERTLYNGLISGLSLGGNLFFYPNTLRCDGITPFNRGSLERSPWFDCSCCPSNLSRFIPSVGGYAYAVRDGQAYVNLFMNSSVELETENGTMQLRQESNYPWDGNIRIEILNEKPVEAILNIRIPGWVINRPVPSDLFHYTDPPETAPEILVNGEAAGTRSAHGYSVLDRKWVRGDVVQVSFPMKVKRIVAIDSVKAKTGLAAFEYGPIVYCGESIDNGDGELELVPSYDTSMHVHYEPDLLHGIDVIDGRGKAPSGGKEVEQDIRLIPYYAWDHRGPGKMNVWFRR